MTERISMKNLAYNVIKNKILSNEFKSGQHLEERKLTEMIGVSRTPIREALNLLENEGFVTSRQNSGIFVTPIDIRYSKELFQARYYLEPIVLELAWPHIELDAIKEFNKQTLEYIEQDDMKGLNEIDYEIHTYINSQCRNSVISEILNRLQDQFQRVRTLDYYNHERILGGANEHLQLFNFLLENEKEKGIECLKKHIKSTEKYYYMSLLND